MSKSRHDGIYITIYAVKPADLGGDPVIWQCFPPNQMAIHPRQHGHMAICVGFLKIRHLCDLIKQLNVFLAMRHDPHVFEFQQIKQGQMIFGITFARQHGVIRRGFQTT